MDSKPKQKSKDRLPKLELIKGSDKNPDRLYQNAQTRQVSEDIDLMDPSYYENRELSHFKFNLRVLSQAKNLSHPLLERLMFLLIFSSNLDEFFEIRISGLKKQLESGRQRPGPDGKFPDQVLKIIHEQVREALDEQYRILNEDLLPDLARENIHFLQRHEWSKNLKAWTKRTLSQSFDKENFIF
mgnify:CR=1 FL=1